MSRAVGCLLVLLLLPILASQAQAQIVTLPDGSQIDVQTTVVNGVQGGIAGGIVGALVSPQVAVPPTGQRPVARDTRPTTGNSRIRGRVLIADTMQPARRATVRLSSPEMREMRMTTTDLDGRYDVANLPAGRYSITATKNGFISLSYGQTRPTTPAQTVTLVDKQNADGVDLIVLRGGAIAGRVLDDFGDPVSGVTVMALRQQFQQGQPRLMPFGMRSTTNDIGEYRMFALPAGSYYLAATVSTNVNPSQEASEERNGFAPVFYPGTTDASSAVKVSVGFGQTVPEINFSLTGTRLAQVTGVALDSQGRPMTAGNVTAQPRGRVQGLPAHSGQLKPDGTFAISNMPPGDYLLRANMRPTPVPPSAPGAPRPPAPRPEVATAVVTVSGSDVSGVRLAPAMPATVTGRVVFDNPSAAVSLQAATIRVMPQLLNPNDSEAIGNPLQSPPSPLKDDFTFELQIAPGVVMLRPNIPGGPPAVSTGPVGAPTQPMWLLKSLRVNGSDVTNTGLELRPGEHVSGVEITMTNRPPEVSGIVTASGNTPASGFSVIIFAQDRDLWSMPGPGLSAMMRTDQTGHFSTRNLRPGRYYILAVYELEQGSSGDPEFLQAAMSRATAFSLSEGETKTLELRGEAR